MTESRDVGVFCYFLNIFNPILYGRIIESVCKCYFMES